MEKPGKTPLFLIAFGQALALVLYIVVVASFINQAESWLDQIPDLLGGILFITIFSTSALMAASLTLGYPIYLFWKTKKFDQSIRLVVYTIVWLLVFITTFISLGSYSF